MRRRGEPGDEEGGGIYVQDTHRRDVGRGLCAFGPPLRERLGVGIYVFLSRFGLTGEATAVAS